MSMEAALEPHFTYLEKNLTPARLQHSLGVMAVMAELAPIYGLEPHAARLAGLAHDAGKELPLAQMLEIAERLHLKLAHPADRDALFLHGPASAYVAQHRMGITDPRVLEAIGYHSYMLDGPVQSPAFVWCLRFADLLEPGRDWVDMKQRSAPLVYGGRLAEAAYVLTDWLVPFLEGVGVLSHPRQVRLIEQLREHLAHPDGKPVPV
jgi:predicted HD superfamily hydrolase involved in NAD metabolism